MARFCLFRVKFMSAIALIGAGRRAQEREAREEAWRAHPYYPLGVEVNLRFGEGAAAFLIFPQEVPDPDSVQQIIAQLSNIDRFRGKSVDVTTYPIGQEGQEVGTLIILKPVGRRVVVSQR